MGNLESSEATEDTPSGNKPQASMGDTDLDSNEEDASQDRSFAPSQEKLESSEETDEIPSVKEPHAATRDANLDSDEADVSQDRYFAVPQANSESSEETDETLSGSKPQANIRDTDLDSDEEDASQDRSVAPSQGKSKITENTDEISSVNKSHASIRDANLDSVKADVPQDRSFAVPQGNSVSCEATDEIPSGSKPLASRRDTNLDSDDEDAAEDPPFPLSQGESVSSEATVDIPSENKPHERTSDTNLGSDDDDDVPQDKTALQGNSENSEETDEVVSGNKPDAITKDTNLDCDEEDGTQVTSLATDETPSGSKPQASIRDTNLKSDKADASQDRSVAPSQGKSKITEDTDEIPSVNKSHARMRDSNLDSDKADVSQDRSFAVPKENSESSEVTDEKSSVYKPLASTRDTNLDSDEEYGTQDSFVSELQASSESSQGTDDTGGVAKEVDRPVCGNSLLFLMVAMVLILGTAVGILFRITNRPSSDVASLWQPLGPEIHGDGALDSFGGTVALSADGTILAAGGMGIDKRDAGHVSIFSYDPIRSSWNLLGQELVGLAEGDWFGDSLALSANGTIVAAGAPYHDKNGVASGQVQVHEYGTVTNLWKPIGQPLYGEADYEFFGSSVALSADGTVLAISAPTNDGAARDAGCVYVYSLDRSLNLWVLLGQRLNGVSVSDGFGEFLALSSNGKVMVVSAPYHDDDAQGTYRGHVQVYEYDTASNRWNQLGQNLDGEETYERFGRSVAMSADGMTVAAASSWSHYDQIHPGCVRVYAFDRVSNLWNPVGQDLHGEAAGDAFGEAMALSSDGTILAVGAKGNDHNGKCSGNTRLFEYDNKADHWNYLGQALEGQVAGDFFGQAVDLSANGSVVVVGATSNDGNGQDSGHVRVFTSQ